MARRKRKEYPRVIYGPYGAARTIHGPDEWIRGWTIRPEDSAAPAPAQPRTVPLTRRDMKERLRALDLPFNERAANSELWETLQRYG